MLIRTPPEQVLPVYKKFVDKYPKLEDLYRAELDDIEKTIKSLGFKWRAKRLKRMAEYIIEKTNGKFPCNLKELKRVPGIGEYTAAAILTFSYKKRAVPVDSNTVR
ncbi:MAG: DNA glycosylase, partial [bacterium]